MNSRKIRQVVGKIGRHLLSADGPESIKVWDTQPRAGL
jgi:hypothetical protein